jgi:hypothetical protein
MRKQKYKSLPLNISLKILLQVRAHAHYPQQEAIFTYQSINFSSPREVLGQGVPLGGVQMIKQNVTCLPRFNIRILLTSCLHGLPYIEKNK